MTAPELPQLDMRRGMEALERLRLAVAEFTKREERLR
jgi:hypothetical protein